MASDVLEASEYRFDTLTPSVFISEIIRAALTVCGMWVWESKISICSVSVDWLMHELLGLLIVVSVTSGILIVVTVTFGITFETFSPLIGCLDSTHPLIKIIDVIVNARNK